MRTTTSRTAKFRTPYLAALVATLAAGLSPTFAADGDSVIHLTYTEVHDRILPFPELTSTVVNLDIHLQADSTVQHDEARASGTAKGAGSQRIKLGKEQGQSWHVAGPNKLVNVRDYYSYTRAIEVTVSGNTCDARVGYSLKPGYHDYQYPRLMNGERATARSVSAGNVACSIR